MKARAEKSYASFYRQAWDVIECGRPFVSNWHIEAISEHLEAVSLGHIRRLLINIQPRVGKSNQVTVCWPAWTWIKKPLWRWMFVSYAAELSIEHSIKRRTLIMSDWYQRNWGDRFTLTKSQEDNLHNDRLGRMLATSIGGSPTGRGGDCVVVDDPHNPKKAESDAERKSAIRFCQQTLSTRLDDKKKGATVVVMQRLHEEDWSAHVLAEGGYVHLCLPTIAEEKCIVQFPITARERVREVGDILWPAREGPDELAQAKRAMGSYAFAGQYQQRPAPAGGEVFKRDWFRYWTPCDGGRAYNLHLSGTQTRQVRIADCTRIGVMDVAQSDDQSADWTVLQVWDITPDYDMVLVHQWRAQAQSPEVISQSAKIARDYQTDTLIVESNGVGLGVLQHLRSKGISTRKVVARGDKVFRARVAAQARMEAGTVFFPAGAGFVETFEHELLGFPNAAHDDCVDAFAHSATYVQRMGGAVRTREDREAEDEAADADQDEKLQERIEEHKPEAWEGDDNDSDQGWTTIF